jgi:hypothetical protein
MLLVAVTSLAMAGISPGRFSFITILSLATLVDTPYEIAMPGVGNLCAHSRGEGRQLRWPVDRWRIRRCAAAHPARSFFRLTLRVAAGLDGLAGVVPKRAGFFKELRCAAGFAERWRLH